MKNPNDNIRVITKIENLSIYSCNSQDIKKYIGRVFIIKRNNEKQELTACGKCCFHSYNNHDKGVCLKTTGYNNCIFSKYYYTEITDEL